MSTTIRLALFLLGAARLLAPTGALAHGTARAGEPGDRAIEFPDVPGFRTLVVDLHTHSVFSDGHVWPRTRVEEAMRDGLDGIAITEHLEWQPHLADIPHPDRNRAYEIAARAAGDAELMVIAGSEITRSAPAGHMNAVFLSDANALIRPPEPTEPYDPRAYLAAAEEWPAQEAVQAANDQGAFVFWNHPYWTRQKPDGIARINDFHRDNARKGLLHGIEIANGQTYSEEAFRIALDHDLTPIGVSDVHDLIDWDYEPHAGGHRPVNLVFAKERSPEALRAALFEGRTVVWFKNLVLGRAEHLAPLLAASLTAVGDGFLPRTELARVTLQNHSDARWLLRNRTDLTFMGSADLVEVPPHEAVDLLVKLGERATRLALDFEVVNALTAPKTPAGWTAEVALDPTSTPPPSE